MNVAWTPGQLGLHLKVAGDVSEEHPVVISQFIERGREIDLDAVAKNGDIVCHAISEHIESAGVHSGDATLVLPPYSLDEQTLELCRETAKKVAKALNVTGPMNMQLIAKNGTVKIIEANIRASRSFPFSSKTVGGDFAEAATAVMVGKEPPAWCKDKDLGLTGKGAYPKTYYGVKAPMFSFKRLAGADPTLGVEMASTGETATFATTVDSALLSSLLSTLNFKLPTKKRVLISIQEKLREDFGPSFKQLSDMGYEILATEETAAHVARLGLKSTRVRWPHEKEDEEASALPGPLVDELIKSQEIDFALMFSNQSSRRTEINYLIRRLAVDFGVPLFTDIHVAIALTKALKALSDGKIKLETKPLVEFYADEKKANKH